MLKSFRYLFASVNQVSSTEIRRCVGTTSCFLQNDHFTPQNKVVPEAKRRPNIPRYPRTLSTLNSTTVPKPIVGTVLPKDESREFMAVFPDIVRDLTDAGRHTDIPEANKWFAKVLQYNVPTGKKYRGFALVYSYKKLVQPEKLTPENLRLAYIMGWCVEMLQAHFLVEDDIIDQSENRRGKPCWYKYNNLGLAAINDGLLLESGVYHLLRLYFRNMPYYLHTLELFLQVTQKTILGQHLDIHSTDLNGRPKFDKFTMDRYNSIVKYKTAFYSCYLPVALAMQMAGFKDDEMYRQAKTILLEMGHFFQVQDDYLDCFGESEITGKLGSKDIEAGKCSWLAVVALQRVTPKQRALFEQCYGYKDPVKVAAVKELYEQLGLPATYATYEEESYNLISTQIQQISRGLPHQIFFKFLDTIYRREG
uniref:Farnesyl pyrophosphate synthase n=1 Tax=Timema cristinae TaxID=61476 RepID=A0A7R9H4K0_TIMCR|nr:unnamed protein product [Timema cristinae]